MPGNPSLPSPPAPASLRSGAGAAWKGQSSQFAPSSLPVPSRSARRSRGCPRSSIASPSCPRLAAPATSSCKISHPARSRGAGLGPGPWGPLAPPWGPKTRRHGGLGAAPSLLEHPRELLWHHLLRESRRGEADEDTAQTLLGVPGPPGHHKCVPLCPASDVRAAGAISAPRLRQLQLQPRQKLFSSWVLPLQQP